MTVPAPTVVGWKEYVDLPELGIYRLKAKLDSGARTSALHVSALQTLALLPDGRREVELVLSPSRRRRHQDIAVRATVVDDIRVTDSGGHPEVRPLIETLLVAGPLSRRIHLTLTDRSAMLFPLILGRRAFAGVFLIDSARKYLLGRARRGLVAVVATGDQP